ncbi:MAG: hypothetical protein Q9160_005708 [Pyrenula sp. 1 TL-2023]
MSVDFGEDDSPPDLVLAESFTDVVTEVGTTHLPPVRKVPIKFGDSADIEKSLTVSKDGQQVEEWLSLANGCICCSVKDQGVNAIESLMDRQGTFDYILLETTGLADPGNIAPIFWVDTGLGSTIYLDGIVTVVDAKNILRCLDEPAHEEEVSEIDHPHMGPTLSTAHLQVSHADVIILNKTDLVNQTELQTIKERIQSINALAKILTTTHARIEQLSGTLLDLHAYDNTLHSPLPDFQRKGHSHLDPSISTITIAIPPLDRHRLAKLEQRLQALLWENEGQEKGVEIHRLKGYVPLTDGPAQVIQGVREIFELVDADVNADIGAQGKLVIIGKSLQHVQLKI